MQAGLEVGVEAPPLRAVAARRAAGLLGEGQHHGERVLHAVVQLAQEQRLPLRRRALFGDFDGGADQARRPGPASVLRPEPGLADGAEPARAAVGARPRAAVLDRAAAVAGRVQGARHRGLHRLGVLRVREEAQRVLEGEPFFGHAEEAPRRRVPGGQARARVQFPSATPGGVEGEAQPLFPHLAGFRLGREPRRLPRLPAVLQAPHGHDGERRQPPPVGGRQAAWARLGREDAYGAQRLAVRRDERHAGVEADARPVEDQGVVGEERIGGGIGHHQALAPGAERVVAERPGARHPRGVDPDARLGPLPVLVHERDERDGRLEEVRRERRDLVELALGGCSNTS